MTSFAFILGVLPLALATGAGAGARNSVGTTVAGGMLASTFLSVIFIPVLYVAIRTIAPGRGRGRGRTRRPSREVRMCRAVRARGALFAVCMALGVGRAAAQTPPMEQVEFDAAIQRALEKNPAIAQAANAVARAETLLIRRAPALLPNLSVAFSTPRWTPPAVSRAASRSRRISSRSSGTRRSRWWT